MKKSVLSSLCCCLLLSSCSYQQFDAVAKGSALGGMFGSSVGALMNGPRGYYRGSAAGMLVGAAAGAAVTGAIENKNKVKGNDYENEPDYASYDSDYTDNSIEYGPYESNSNKSPRMQDVASILRVKEVRFSDANNNRYLETDEQASIEMTIYNTSDYTLYDIAPQISCDKKHILISPAAYLRELAPGQGFRYRAEILSTKRLKDGVIHFDVGFDLNNGHKAETVKTFCIRTMR